MLRLVSLFAAACAVIFPLFITGELSAGEIEKILDQPTNLQFKKTPLDEAVEYLVELHDIPISINKKALNDEYLGLNVPVTACIKGAKLRIALECMLANLGLVHVIDDGRLLITTQADLEANHTLDKLYAVGDLVVENKLDLDELVEIITTCVYPDSWKGTRGYGTIQMVTAHGKAALRIKTTDAVHGQITNVLDGLRRCRRGLPIRSRPAVEAKLDQKLDQLVTLEYDSVALRDIATDLKSRFGISIWIDRQSLCDGGLDENVLITFSAKGIPLRSALNLMLYDLDLAYKITDDVLRITSWYYVQEECQLVRVYPVGDFPNRDNLVKVIAMSIAPSSWNRISEEVGIRLVEFEGGAALVIGHSDWAHRKVAKCLDKLRRCQQSKPCCPKSPTVQKIEKALELASTFSYENTPLKTVAADLRKRFDIEVWLDREALDDAGLKPDVPIKFNADGITLRSALGVIFRELDLTHVVMDDVLAITTQSAGEEYQRIEVYSVDRLCDSSEYEVSDLIESIITCISPYDWREVGGEGEIEPLEFVNGQALVVLQQSSVHRQIAYLLSNLQLCQQGRDYLPRHPTELKIEKSLEKTVELNYVETPLFKVAANLKKRFGIEVQLDRQQLANEGLNENMPITFVAKRITLHSALDLILAPSGLTNTIWNETLLITTTAAVYELPLRTVVYPVVDLAEWDPTVDFDITPPSPGGWQEPPSGPFLHTDSLMGMLTVLIDPCNWTEVGGEGAMCPAYFGGINGLIISQTEVNHRKITKFLEELRGLSRGNTPDTIPTRKRKTEQIIIKLLGEPIDLEYVNTPLQEVVTDLEKRLGVAMRIDPKAADKIGDISKVSINFSMKDATLRSALGRMLDNHGMAFSVWDETLFISTPEVVSDNHFRVMFYPVDDIYYCTTIYNQHEYGNNIAHALALLQHTIETYAYEFDTSVDNAMLECCRPEMWSYCGGGGAIAHSESLGINTFIILQTDSVHREIAAFLRKIRRITNGKTIGQLDPSRREKTEKRIRNILHSPIQMNYNNASFFRVVADLKKRLGVEVQIDEKAFRDALMKADSPVTFAANGTTLLSALDQMLAKLDLTYTVWDECLLITSPKAASEKYLRTEVYRIDNLGPVAELIEMFVDPDSWQGMGGAGKIAAVRVDNEIVLAVFQTDAVHRKISAMIDELQKKQTQKFE